MSRSGLVTLLTDFGPGSPYVGQMHGTILRRAPALRIIDLAHDCPPGAVAAAAYLLDRSVRHFSPGTVHVAVVDPGVGSDRAVLAARARGHIFLAPDNGLLGPILDTESEPDVRRVTNEELMNERVSRTFHGRDVFAPIAAYLAAGGALSAVGPQAGWEPARPGPEPCTGGIAGRILLVDRFGNLITDVPGRLLAELGDPGRIRVRAGATFIQGIVDTFSDVPRGDALTYIGSGEHLELAVNGGRAADLLQLAPGDAIRVESGGA